MSKKPQDSPKRRKKDGDLQLALVAEDVPPKLEKAQPFSEPKKHTVDFPAGFFQREDVKEFLQIDDIATLQSRLESYKDDVTARINRLQKLVDTSKKQEQKLALIETVSFRDSEDAHQKKLHHELAKLQGEHTASVERHNRLMHMERRRLKRDTEAHDKALAKIKQEIVEKRQRRADLHTMQENAKLEAEAAELEQQDEDIWRNDGEE